jgi:hypothetical protein
MDKSGFMSFYKKIKIVIKNKTANVEASASFTTFNKIINLYYTMVLEEGKWRIMDQDF